MFGLFKSKRAPDGPARFVASVDIARPVGEVYALIDWADTRNAKRATGNRVIAVRGKPDRFDMIMPTLPDLTFEFLVTEDTPNEHYAFGCVIRPGCGNLAHSHESYEFEPLGADSCRVTLETSVTFIGGLSLPHYSQEVAVMAASVQSALQKLKLQAEHGPEIAQALAEHTVL